VETRSGLARLPGLEGSYDRDRPVSFFKKVLVELWEIAVKSSHIKGVVVVVMIIMCEVK
jgi:hypothetical protein